MTFEQIALTRAEDAERLVLPFGELTVRLTGERTGGALAVVETVLPAGALGAAPHIHHAHRSTSW